MTSPLSVDDLKVKIFADGADLDSMLDLAANPRIKGFTTNPTLMRKAGIDDYRSFARRVLDKITNRPISFEVFADEFDDMHAQALEIASWGPNVNVKIPITNTRGESSAPLVADLSRQGVVVNVTAMFTLEQVRSIVDVLDAQTPAILSIFAGRIADAGRDPVPVMRDALEIMRARPNSELIWASPRELLNIVQAHEIGCHIITVTHDILKKLPTIGKSMEQFSLETVKMFHHDAGAAGYAIATAPAESAAGC
jgi:transaldolase